MSQNQDVDISKIDPNFAPEISDGKEVIWYNVRTAPFRLYGLMRTDDDTLFCRMPDSAAENPAINDGVRQLYTHTAGGRVRFSTDSPYIAFRWVSPKMTRHLHMPISGSAGFDLYVDTDHDSVFHRAFIPDIHAETGCTCAAKSTNLTGMHDFTVHFPGYNRVNEVYIGLAPGAKIGPGKEYQYQKPIVFYGSSITQGACPSRPGNAYTAMTARWLNSDHVNLGFSGSGLAEAEMMEYVASLDAGIFVYDYDHNAGYPEYLAETHERGFKIYREKNPDTPVIFVSMPNWEWENQYHAFEDGKPFGRSEIRRDIVYRTYSNALKSGDKNVAFVDGRSVFARRDRYASTVDGSHPNDLGMFRMAEAVTDAIEIFLRKI